MSLRSALAAPWRTLRRSRRAQLWAALVVAGAALVVVHARRTAAPPAPGSLTYSQLLTALEAKQVDSLTWEIGDHVDGYWTAAAHAARRARQPADSTRVFRVAFPATSDDLLQQYALKGGANLRFVPREGRTAAELVGAVLNLALMVLMVVYLRRAMGGGADTQTAEDTNAAPLTFADVAGQEGAVAELREIVDFLRDPTHFGALGAQVPKGALLAGPPGTGKTLLAKAIAGEAGVPFFAVSGSSITGFIVGMGAAKIRSIFATARKAGGAVIFIDELEILGGKRGARGQQGHNEDDRTLNQLLVEMDGFVSSAGIVVIGATNRPEDLDPALLRPGRFDRQITVGLPTLDGRTAILQLHAARRNVPLAVDVDLARLARLLPGASGADLANVLNEAAITAGRERAPAVAWRHFEAARDRILLGKEQPGFRAQRDEWQTVAYHEAGHAILGVIGCPEDGLHKVTIQPRGQAMGVAHFAPDDDRHLHSRRYLLGVLLKAMGGRAAEEVVFGGDRVTSGARSDLQHANNVARSMVAHLGMGAKTGFLVHDGRPGVLSAQTLGAMDEDVAGLIAEAYAEARRRLEQHRPALDALAAALLDRETLDGAEAVALMAAHGVVIPDPTTAPAGPSRAATL